MSSRSKAKGAAIQGGERGMAGFQEKEAEDDFLSDGASLPGWRV
jgi:hypothetical protein